MSSRYTDFATATHSMIILSFKETAETRQSSFWANEKPGYESNQYNYTLFTCSSKEVYFTTGYILTQKLTQVWLKVRNIDMERDADNPQGRSIHHICRALHNVAHISLHKYLNTEIGNKVHYLSFVKKTPWPESASKLFPPSDRRLSAKLVPTFADRGCHVVNMTDPYGRILGFLDQSRYFFF
jgi:hypothetical protein